MTLHRAFVAPEWLISATLNSSIDLPDDVFHRLSKVVRVSKDEVVELFDGKGLCVRGRLVSSQSPRFQIESIEQKAVGGAKLTLVQALVAPAKLEAIVQDSTELGISQFLLFAAKNSVTKITKRTSDQIARLQRIAIDAARQCERPDVPLISGPVGLAEMLLQLKERGALLLVGDPRVQTRLIDTLADRDLDQEIMLVVGPEGGLDDEELRALTQIGAKSVSYAPYVLRTETAGLVGLSIIQSLVR
jgi:16S rRNA (uracil1498-N3)-methyltransferase